MTVAPTALAKVAQQLVDLQRNVDMLQRNGVDLSHSSFDGGSINQYSAVGGVAGSSFGNQFDGSNGAFSLNGPQPPQPSAAVVTPITGAVRIRWDGTFVGAANAPMDFTSVEVHVSTDLGLTGLLFADLRSSITSPRGGDVIVPLVPDGTSYYAVLVARTQSGQKSIASPVVGPFTPNKVPKEDLGFKLADLGGNTIFFGTTTPTAGAFGDLWLNQTATAPDGAPIYTTSRWTPGVTSGVPSWVALADLQATDAIAVAAASQDTANTQPQEFTQATAPTWTGDTGTAVWFDSSNSNAAHSWNGTAFVPMVLANGSFAPKALVASNVVATGSVTASLLEAILILTNQIIAGDINGTHAKLDSDGLHIFRVGSDGTVSEVIRLGVSGTDDYFGIVDSTGMLVAAIDDTGQANFAGLNVASDPVFQGVALSDTLATYVGQSPGYFYGNPPANGSNPYGPIHSEVGIAEVNGLLSAGRDYEIYWELTGSCDLDDRVESNYTMRYEGPTSADPTQANPPSITSTVVDGWNKTNWWANRWEATNASARFSCTVDGRHRFLLSCSRGGLGINGNTSASVYVRPEHQLSMVIRDIGPTSQLTGQFSQGGGAFFGGSTPAPAPTPKQQYSITLAPAGYRSYRGNGTLRTDTTDVVQGWDPTGYNGDGKGHWWFSLPTITGTVTKVQFYAYANLTYYNSGGQGLLSPTQAGVGGPGYNQVKPQWNPGITWPKPGGMTVTLPSSWWQYYGAGVGGVKFDGVRVGPSGGTNETYYVRFAGPSARLKIWWTQ